MQMRKGCARLSGITFELLDKGSSSDVVECGGGNLLLDNCSIAGGDRGVRVFGGAIATLVRCVMQNCGVGVDCHDRSHVTLDKCEITKVKPS